MKSSSLLSGSKQWASHHKRASSSKVEAEFGVRLRTSSVSLVRGNAGFVSLGFGVFTPETL